MSIMVFWGTKIVESCNFFVDHFKKLPAGEKGQSQKAVAFY